MATSLRGIRTPDVTMPPAIGFSWTRTTLTERASCAAGGGALAAHAARPAVSMAAMAAAIPHFVIGASRFMANGRLVVSLRSPIRRRAPYRSGLRDATPAPAVL